MCLRGDACLFRTENTLELALNVIPFLIAAVFGLWFGLAAYTEAEIFGLWYNL